MAQTLSDLIQHMNAENSAYQDFFNKAAQRITATYKKLEQQKAAGLLSAEDFAAREEELLSIVDGFNTFKETLDKNTQSLADIDAADIPDEMLERPLTPLN